MITLFDEYFNRITDEFASRDQLTELKKGRKEFFDAIGAVHEEDPFFETYMTAFLEWYIFDRDLANKDLPPIRLFYRNHFKEFSDEEKKIYNDFTKFKHSLFFAKKVKEGLLVLQDLHNNETLKIEGNIVFSGFKNGDIFEATLVPFQGEWRFMKSFCFHPPEAKKFICKEMKKIKNLERKILTRTVLKFKKMRLKLERYPHVSAQQIYNEEEFCQNERTSKKS